MAVAMAADRASIHADREAGRKLTSIFICKGDTVVRSQCSEIRPATSVFPVSLGLAGARRRSAPVPVAGDRMSVWGCVCADACRRIPLRSPEPHWSVRIFLLICCAGPHSHVTHCSTYASRGRHHFGQTAGPPSGGRIDRLPLRTRNSSARPRVFTPAAARHPQRRRHRASKRARPPPARGAARSSRAPPRASLRAPSPCRPATRRRGRQTPRRAG